MTNFGNSSSSITFTKSSSLHSRTHQFISYIMDCMSKDEFATTRGFFDNYYIKEDGTKAGYRAGYGSSLISAVVKAKIVMRLKTGKVTHYTVGENAISFFQDSFNR